MGGVGVARLLAGPSLHRHRGIAYFRGDALHLGIPLLFSLYLSFTG
jgi:hypothetical protein